MDKLIEADPLIKQLNFKSISQAYFRVKKTGSIPVGEIGCLEVDERQGAFIITDNVTFSIPVCPLKMCKSFKGSGFYCECFDKEIMRLKELDKKLAQVNNFKTDPLSAHPSIIEHNLLLDSFDNKSITSHFKNRQDAVDRLYGYLQQTGRKGKMIGKIKDKGVTVDSMAVSYLATPFVATEEVQYFLCECTRMAPFTDFLAMRCFNHKDTDAFPWDVPVFFSRIRVVVFFASELYKMGNHPHLSLLSDEEKWYRLMITLYKKGQSGQLLWKGKELRIVMSINYRLSFHYKRNSESLNCRYICPSFRCLSRLNTRSKEKRTFPEDEASKGLWFKAKCDHHRKHFDSDKYNDPLEIFKNVKYGCEM